MRKLALCTAIMLACCAAVASAEQARCLVEAFFVSPAVDQVIERQILAAIDEAQESLFIAMYSFTDDELGQAVIEAYTKRGLDVRILLDESQADGTGGKEWPKLRAAGIPIMVEDVTGLFHHKFAVIDGRLVITGSYNWSASADEQNFENVVFIECEEIA